MRRLAGVAILGLSLASNAFAVNNDVTCEPVLFLSGAEKASEPTQRLAEQLRTLIAHSVSARVRVPVTTTMPSAGTVLQVSVDSSTDLTRVVAQATRDGDLLKKVESEYPTAAASDVAPYFAQGLLRELAVDWKTCDRSDSENPPKAAAYAMVRAASDGEKISEDRVFDLATTALAIDSNIAAGYKHLAHILEARGETGWAKVAEQQAASIDREALAFIPEYDPLPALRAGLAGTGWTTGYDGLESLSVTEKTYGVNLYAWKVDPEKFRLSIKLSQKPVGDHVAALRAGAGDALAINGGFFKEQPVPGDDPAKQRLALIPDGLLVVSGAFVSEAWSGASRNRGGILEIDGSNVRLMPSGEWRGPAPPGSFAVQSKPMLIEPGGKFAMYFDDGIISKRTAVCTRMDGAVVFVLVHGKGLTLHQLARLLHSERSMTVLACDAALAFDGAISSQASYAPSSGPAFEVPGREVPYAITVSAPNDSAGGP